MRREFEIRIEWVYTVVDVALYCNGNDKGETDKEGDSGRSEQKEWA